VRQVEVRRLQQVRVDGAREDGDGLCVEEDEAVGECDGGHGVWGQRGRRTAGAVR
jgi:hypothetical protein